MSEVATTSVGAVLSHEPSVVDAGLVPHGPHSQGLDMTVALVLVILLAGFACEPH